MPATVVWASTASIPAAVVMLVGSITTASCSTSTIPVTSERWVIALMRPGPDLGPGERLRLGNRLRCACRRRCLRRNPLLRSSSPLLTLSPRRDPRLLHTQVGMRHFHYVRNKYHCPIVNLDKIWSLVGEEVRTVAVVGWSQRLVAAACSRFGRSVARTAAGSN